MKRLIVIVLAFALVLNFACAGMTTTEKGAAGGAAAGGLIGGLAGGTRGLIIGALAGAVIGGVAGHYYDKQVGSSAQVQQKYGTMAAPGVRITDDLVRPEAARPGEQVYAQMQYDVLAPPDAIIKVTEARYLDSPTGRIELAKRDVDRTPGTYISTMEFFLPQKESPGEYRIVQTVTASGQTQTAEKPLRIK
jgi:hypothetical protein